MGQTPTLTATAAAPRVTLRAATAADVPFLDQIYASTREAEVAAMGWAPEAALAFLRMQADLQRRAFRSARPDADEQVVLVDGEPGGRLAVDRSGAAIALLDVTLLAEHRGRGIGRQLIGWLQAEASRLTVPVTLHVDHGNPARRLYERLGFVEVGRDQFRSAMAWEPLATERDRYAALVGSAFAVEDSLGGHAGLRLDAVSPLRASPGQESFSLELLGPAAAPLGQGTRELEHEVLGSLALFLVPLGVEGSQIRYEAVFTRLVASHRDRAGEQGGMGA